MDMGLNRDDWDELLVMNVICSGKVLVLCIVLFVAQTQLLHGRTYLIDTDYPRVVGKLSSVMLDDFESLRALAAREQVGLDALAAANPQVVVDARTELLPGTKITLPTRHILPATELRGVVVNLPELRLYYFSDDGGQVSVYPIGIGRSGWSTPELSSTISEIRKNPSWTPPASIHNEARKMGVHLPAVVPPGPDNPLGEIAMRLGATDYLIHGTNKRFGIGQRVSHGCIRMFPDHIRELAEQIVVGTPVTVINQPLKIGRTVNGMLIEGHQPLHEQTEQVRARFKHSLDQLEASQGRELRISVESHAATLLKRRELFNGIPQQLPAGH